MVFSSYIFILVFLPVTLAGYYLLAGTSSPLPQKLWLVAASLIFYAYYHPVYLLLILSSMVVNYILAVMMQKTDLPEMASENENRRIRCHKIFLTVGVLFNVGMLGYFKYYDFFVDTLNHVLHTSFLLKHIVLPLGISFFTFQQLSFIISVYKNEERVDSPVDYAMFVTFFPQLIAGPIVLYSEMRPQFADAGRRHFDADDFAKGLYLFTIGVFKKAVIADTVALFADNGYAVSHPSFWVAWVASVSYTLQIYFDFSGYSDMAVGLAKMFRFDIIFNFASPYRSESISEFWRRWHITLGRALRTYVYYPLGGNRKGKARTYLNLIITFFVSGLWHGASWTFVVWGLLHGICTLIERAAEPALSKIPHIVRVAGTFLIVNFLWILFRAEDFTKAMTMYRGLFSFSGASVTDLAGIAFDGIVNFPSSVDVLYIAVLLLTLLIVVFGVRRSEELYHAFHTRSRTALSCAVMLVTALVCISRGTVFIYYNF